MEGRSIVEAIRAGDPGGLAAAYDEYGARLYGYCSSLLGDPDAAADALHDTLLVAGERIDQLRDPERLRAWLYAIARNECLRQLRLRRRSVALEAASEVSDESIDMDAGPRERELRALVRDAAAGLNPRDREVLDLAIRHDLDPAEVSATLGVSQSHARALLSRAREQLERALGAVLVARDGRGDCEALAGILAGWDGQMTVLLRKRLNRHLESCAVCSETRRRVAAAPAVLSVLPLLLPPPDLRGRILDDAFDPGLVGYRAELGRRLGRLGEDGFPVTRRLPRLPRPLVAAAALMLALGAGVFFGASRALSLQKPLAAAPAPPAVSPGDTPGAVGADLSTGAPAVQATAGTPVHGATPATGARQAPQPVLVVPARLDLGTASTAQLRVYASAGLVDWTATVSDPTVTIKPASGRAATVPDTSVTVAVPARRHAGRAVVTFTYGGGSVSTLVTWDKAPLATPTPTPPIIP